MVIFLLRCPKCRNKMKYATSSIGLKGKVKKCVYCNFNITAKNHILKLGV